MRAHLLLSISLLKRNEALTLLPDANMQRFIRLSYSSHLGILTDLGASGKAKAFQCKRGEQCINQYQNTLELCTGSAQRRSKLVRLVKKQLTDFETDFAARKKPYLQPDQA